MILFLLVEEARNKNFYLHLLEQSQKNGATTKLYYFAGEVRSDAIDVLPEAYVVAENERTGLPFLKKKG